MHGMRILPVWPVVDLVPNIALMVANAPKYIMEQLPANALNETSLVLGKPNKKTSAVYRITAAGTRNI